MILRISVPNPVGIPVMWQRLLLPRQSSAEGMGPRNLTVLKPNIHTGIAIENHLLELSC